MRSEKELATIDAFGFRPGAVVTTKQNGPEVKRAFHSDESLGGRRTAVKPKTDRRERQPAPKERKKNGSAAETNPYINGAIAGLIATGPMTLSMLACHKRLPVSQRYPLPPSLITQRAVWSRAPVIPAPMPNVLSTLAAHFAFGALSGALFAAVPAAMRRQCPVTTGISHGLTVWAGSYLGWVPALRLMPAATQQPAARNAMMIAAHVVLGATLGLVIESVRSRARNSTPTTAIILDAAATAPDAKGGLATQ
jgi:hypothetical protein